MKKLLPFLIAVASMLGTNQVVATEISVGVLNNFLPYSGLDTRYGCDRQDLVGFGNEVSGATRMCEWFGSLRAQMYATALNPGEAYTVWWVYFDDVQACQTPGECGLPDFEGENPLAVFGRMDGTVARASGNDVFYGSLRSFEPSPGSQIWLLMFGHGEVDHLDNRHKARQLLTPEDPNAGTPHLGNAIDGGLGFPVAVSIFDF